MGTLTGMRLKLTISRRCSKPRETVLQLLTHCLARRPLLDLARCTSRWLAPLFQYSYEADDHVGVRRAANTQRGKMSFDAPRLLSLTKHRLQRIAEGLSEDEAWRLFQQVVDALVHMSSLGIVCVRWELF